MSSLDNKYNKIFRLFAGLVSNIKHKLSTLCPDEIFIRYKFYRSMNKKLNLSNPQTFNEKLQWLKLYDRNPLYSIMVDKYEAKKYVGKIIGEEYIIPTFGVWNSFDEIDFKTLPNKFVLKTTHDSGGIVICRDKNTFDYEAARKKLTDSLNTNFYYTFREWPYKNVKPRIIAEEYLDLLDSDSITDYKVHNFNGLPKIILTCRDRFSSEGLAEDFYTDKWEYLDCKRPNHRNAGPMPKPNQLDEILNISRILSKGFPFIRSDFYIYGEKILFGELTLYPAAGFNKFIPQKYDNLFGSYLNLPNTKSRN